MIRKINPLGNTRSSWIDSVSYNSATRELSLALAGGRGYKFASVPEAVVDAMEASGSWGTFFNEKVKGEYAMMT